jgi:F-box-like
LNEDVLLKVFGQLDYEELVQCEAVCRQWREMLVCGQTWKKWFQKQVALSPPWREIWKKMAIDENALEPSDYRAICRQTYQYVKELNSNWCTGQFAQRNVLLPFGGYDVHFCDDWIVAHWKEFDFYFKRRMSSLYFLEKNSRHVTEWMTGPRCDLHYTDKNFVICSFQNSTRNFIGIFDRRISKFTIQIKTDDEFDIICATLYNDLLGVVY